MSNFQTHLCPPAPPVTVCPPPLGLDSQKMFPSKFLYVSPKTQQTQKKKTWAKLLTEIGCRAMSYKYIYICVHVFFVCFFFVLFFLLLLTTCFFCFLARFPLCVSLFRNGTKRSNVETKNVPPPSLLQRHLHTV